MHSTKPMDRLVCGDVGYGKTELAMRAAFRSAVRNRQVAVLVPTTVLAQQHDQSFRERMADYPIRIESLSRFKSKKDQKKILKELAGGRDRHRDRHPPARPARRPASRTSASSSSTRSSGSASSTRSSSSGSARPSTCSP
jgi:hypothetical protein